MRTQIQIPSATPKRALTLPSPTYLSTHQYQLHRGSKQFIFMFTPWRDACSAPATECKVQIRKQSPCSLDALAQPPLSCSTRGATLGPEELSCLRGSSLLGPFSEGCQPSTTSFFVSVHVYLSDVCCPCSFSQPLTQLQYRELPVEITEQISLA